MFLITYQVFCCCGSQGLFTTWLKYFCSIIILYCIHTSYLRLRPSSNLLHGLIKGKITLHCNLTTTTPKLGLKSLQQPFWQVDDDGGWNSNEALCASILEMCMAKTLASTMELQCKLMQIERMVTFKNLWQRSSKSNELREIDVMVLFKPCSKLRSSQLGSNEEFEDGI